MHEPSLVSIIISTYNHRTPGSISVRRKPSMATGPEAPAERLGDIIHPEGL